MKRLLCVLLAALLLTGCAMKNTDTPTAAPTTAPQEPTAPTQEPTNALLESRLPVEGCDNAWYLPLAALDGLSVPELYLFDGALLAFSGGYDGDGVERNYTLRRIDLNDGTLTAEYTLESGFASVRVGEDGVAVWSADDRTVRLLDARLNETSRVSFDTYDVCVGADLRTAYLIGWDSGVQRMELATGEVTPLLEHVSDVYYHDATQTELIVSYMDGATQRNTARLLDLRTGALEALPIEGDAYQAHRSGDTWVIERASAPGRYAIVTADGVRLTEPKLTRFELLAPRAELLDFDAEGVGMTLYDADGSFRSRCVLPDADYVGRTVVWYEPWSAYLLPVVGSDGKCSLVLWEPTASASGEPLTLTDETLPVGVTAAPELYERAERIGAQYGIDLRIADRCALGYSAYTAAEVSDSTWVSLALDILEGALAEYPTGYFRQLLFGNVQSIRVELVGNLAPNADAGLGGSAAAFAQELGGEYLVVFDVYTLSAGNVFHEFTHVTDRRLAWDAQHRADALFNEESWAALNPQGFAYCASYEDYPGSMWEYSGTGCFASDYSMTFPTEDRATMMETAMNGDLLRQDYWAPLREKLRYYSACLRDCFDTTDWQSPTAWEASLT